MTLSEQSHTLHVCFDTVENVALDITEHIFSGFGWKKFVFSCFQYVEEKHFEEEEYMKSFHGQKETKGERTLYIV